MNDSVRLLRCYRRHGLAALLGDSNRRRVISSERDVYSRRLVALGARSIAEPAAGTHCLVSDVTGL